LEQERLIRDVSINTALYSELRKQFELARIEEVKNVPIINVLDRAIPATKKSSPKRSLIVLFALVMGGTVSVMHVLYKHIFRRRLILFFRLVAR
jgi:tyrosine-protein kinase Etk/Wzc